VRKETEMSNRRNPYEDLLDEARCVIAVLAKRIVELEQRHWKQIRVIDTSPAGVAAVDTAHVLGYEVCVKTVGCQRLEISAAPIRNRRGISIPYRLRPTEDLCQALRDDYPFELPF
jgi:hypothetical protein